jgi:hypothetical protein
MPNAPTPSWGLSSNALEDLVTGLMDYTLELWSVCSLVENEHVVIWKIPSTFWKRRVREILQTEMQWPRTPVLVATTAQKCKETVHKEPVVLQKKSFLSQHSQVAGVSVSTAPYFATVCVFFFHGFGVMTHDVLSSDAKLENSRQLPKIHKTSWYHPGTILVSSWYHPWSLWNSSRLYVQCCMPLSTEWCKIHLPRSHLPCRGPFGWNQSAASARNSQVLQTLPVRLVTCETLRDSETEISIPHLKRRQNVGDRLSGVPNGSKWAVLAVHKGTW